MDGLLFETTQMGHSGLVLVITIITLVKDLWYLKKTELETIIILISSYAHRTLASNEFSTLLTLNIIGLLSFY